MEQFTQDIPGPVEAYETIFVPAMLSPLARATMSRADLENGERLLDLACGTGIVARWAAPLLGEDGAIVAVDISPEMLAKARSLPTPAGASVEWRHGDAIDLELPDGGLDVVICQQGLQYLSDPAACMNGCRRVLTDRGRAVFSTWCSLEHAPLFKKMTEAEARHLEKLGVTYEELAAPFLMDSAEELRNLAEAAGFRQVAVIELVIEARFPSAARFVEDVEVAYASVMPQFVENPRAFHDFVEKVERDMGESVERYRDGDGVRFEMKTHLTVAQS